MSKYTGIHCPVCEKPFSDTDDIVVCPECGAPHHRECYLNEGHCHFESEHGTRESWKRPDEATINGHVGIKCPKCSSPNPPSSLFCEVCGARLNNSIEEKQEQNTEPNFGPPPISPNPYTTLFGGIDPQEEIAGITAKDWAMFIGNRSYYFLPRFKAI